MPTPSRPSPRQRLLNARLARGTLARGAAYALNAPVHAYLQVASGCNLDCYMCSEHLRPVNQRHGRGLVALSRPMFDKVAEEVFPFASQLTIGVGGEPTLSPDFVYFLERAHAEGLEVHLVTNGTRLDREDVAESVARCVSYVQISIDGATAETYERIRVGSTWARIRQNLALFNRFRAVGPRRAHVTFCMVLMRSNVHELTKYVEFAHEFGADMVHAQHVIPVTSEGLQECLIDEPERYNAARAPALARAAELGLRVRFPDEYPIDGERATKSNPQADGRFSAESNAASTIATSPTSADAARDVGFVPEPVADLDPTPVPDASNAHAGPATPSPSAIALGHALMTTLSVLATEALADHASDVDPHVDDPLRRHRVRCGMPTLETYVFYDGRVFPCCHPHAHRQMQVGDLRVQSFAEIWNGAHYRELRRGLVSGNVPAICNSCSIVHDPPPALEDPRALETSPGLAAHYALPACGANHGGGEGIALSALRARVKALAIEDERLHEEEAAELRRWREHAANLDVIHEQVRFAHEHDKAELHRWREHAHNLEKMLSRWGYQHVYRAMGRVKDVFKGRGAG